MNLRSTEKTVWYCGNDEETRLLLKRILLEQPPLLCLSSISDVAKCLDTKESPAVLVIDLHRSDAAALRSLLSDRIELQNRTLLIIDDMAAPELHEFCSESACEFIVRPLLQNELGARIAKVFQTPILNARLTLELLQSFGAELTSTEVKLLFCFLANETRSVTRERIMSLLWSGLNVHPRTFDVHLFNLRKKLIDKGLQIFSDRGGKWTLVTSKETNEKGATR